MALDIHLFLTTRKDGLPDLRTHQDVEEVKAWFSKVRNVAVSHNRFNVISDALIKEAEPHPVVGGHSIVFYAPGELHEADEVGHELEKVFTKHHKSFDWHLGGNPHLQSGNFEVYVEIIVEKD